MLRSIRFCGSISRRLPPMSAIPSSADTKPFSAASSSTSSSLSSLPSTPSLYRYMLSSYEPSVESVVQRIDEVEVKGSKMIAVELADTIAHPQGGGQPADLGTIQGLAFTHVQKRLLAPEVANAQQYFAVQHLFPVNCALSFAVGERVRVAIDFARRRSSMAHHSGGHWLALMVEQAYPQLRAINGHHFPGESKVVFRCVDSAAKIPDAKEIESKLKEMIEEAAKKEPTKVSIHISPSGDRSVEFDGHTKVPCGGTHVAETSDIGKISIRKVKAAKGDITVGYACEI